MLKSKLPQNMTPNRRRPRRSLERNFLFDYSYEIVKYIFHVKIASRSCSLHFTVDPYGYASFDQGPLGIVLTSHGATEAALAPYIFCTQMIRMIGTAHGASKASVAPWSRNFIPLWVYHKMQRLCPHELWSHWGSVALAPYIFPQTVLALGGSYFFSSNYPCVPGFSVLSSA